jgi:16S rRNA processing protein RimM
VSAERDTRIIVGEVVGVFGVRGWVKLHSFTDPRTNIFEFDEIELGRDGAWWPARLVEGRCHGKGLIGRFDGIDDRDHAAGLMGNEIAVWRSQLPPTAGDDVYWIDLIGLEVVNAADETLGTVERLIETGANDVLVVSGETERLIPFVRGEVVREIDRSRKRIVVDWEKDY